MKSSKKFFLGSFIAVVVSLVVIVVGVKLINEYETGILEVAADQQDAYVQLVLDQISIKENRDDQDIIQNILSSLDASTYKYWTFAKDDAMLFVKDIVETNKYKGFNESTYYTSSDAQDFIQNLKLNLVSHKKIEINGNDYIVSGVLFSYNDANYRLCMLSNSEVFLDNNNFLRSRINLTVFMGVVVLIMMINALVLFHMTNSAERKNELLRERILDLNYSNGRLNEMVRVRTTYNVRRMVFNRQMLLGFLRRIELKKDRVGMVSYGLIQVANREEFLKRAQVLLDRSVLRFGLRDMDKLALLFVQSDKAVAEDLLKKILRPEDKILTLDVWDFKDMSADQIFEILSGENPEGEVEDHE
ncbi:MAG: hypothetical protein K6G62_05120 [Eubacterium sp.]|nr:hypothetical protein [Eubacterium sp.]